ncbi:MAG: hypothetical protein CSA66_02785 [Proteobacteria bacterium]|nr:MAG: hypothetical protein CSA66_02785 [Pseudomonadota bacterium]
MTYLTACTLLIAPTIVACATAPAPISTPQRPLPAPIDFDALSTLDDGFSQGRSAPDAVTAHFRPTSEDGEFDTTAAQMPDGSWLVSGYTCDREDETVCTGAVVVARGDGRLIARYEAFTAASDVLPVDMVVGYLTPTLIDVVGDGQDELVLAWVLEGDPEPMVGQQSEEFVAVLRLPELEPLFAERVGADGAGAQESCRYGLVARDDDHDGRRELYLTQDCTSAICRPGDDDGDPDGNGIDDESCPGERLQVTKKRFSL